MHRVYLFAFLILTTSCLAADAPPAAEEIPFQFSNGFILLEARTSQDAKPSTFLLDSGAGASVLDLRSARRLHVPLGVPIQVHGVKSQSVAYRIPSIQATNGASTLTTISLALDLTNAEKLCGQPVEGLIGVDFFLNRIVQIDFAAHRIRFPLKAGSADGAETLPIRFKNKMMCVPVSVNGSRPRWTRFDTGCNDALHWVIPRPKETGNRPGVSIGFVTDSRDQTLTSVRLGKRLLPSVETSLHGRELFPDEAGLLGAGVLSQFTVTIDARRRRVYLQPPVEAARKSFEMRRMDSPFEAEGIGARTAPPEKN